MKFKQPLLIIASVILSVSIFAQNDLRNIDTAYLKQCLLQHKNIHFVFTHDPKNPIQFYETSQQQSIPRQSGQSNFTTSLQSNFHLLKDINTQTDANPTNNDFFETYGNVPYVIFNGAMYFSAFDGTHGIQLWRSDGTAAGTYRVSNIQPGTAPIAEIRTMQDKIFFRAESVITNIYQLYVSDGTVKGTFLLKDLVRASQGINGSYYITPVDNTVYFFTDTYNYYPQLWKTDGTIPNTVMVKDFTNIGQAPYLATQANGLFYFTLFTDQNGRELWRSDGTNAGTFMVKDITPGTNFNDGPFQLTAFRNKLYFSDNDGTGRKLWLTNGTEQGTVLAAGNNDVTLPDDFLLSFANKPFTVSENNLYTKASTPSSGTELFKYGVTGGFKLLKDITPGERGGNVSNIISFNNGIAFVYTDSLSQTNKLFISNGNVGNVNLIQSSGSYLITFENLAAADSVLYFTYQSSNAGRELWQATTTSKTARMVKDIYADAVSSNPINLTFFNNKLYFNAASKGSGTELWQTNGTEESTSMVAEINTKSTSSSSANYVAYQFSNDYKDYVPGAALSNELFFSATKPETGYELYKSNGKISGTGLAKDIVKGETGSNPYQFKNGNGTVYFVLLSDTFKIYKIDSAGKSTQVASANSFIQSFDVTKNGLVLYLVSNNSGIDLWRSDGTGAGTFILKSFSQTGFNLVTAGNTGYFTASDSGNNGELWKTDGTIAGTQMVKDINAGPDGSNPYSLHIFNGEVYFGAYDGSDNAFWKSDGTNAGTIKLKAIQPYYSIGPFDFFCVLKNRLYFSAYTANFGYQLWKTDGTPDGTKIVKDGYEISNPSFLTNVNGTLFFGADNHNLYKSDGTSAGTVVVKNISVPDYYLYDDRCVADGKLFFNTGHTLWVSDGTDSGTYQINDKGLQGVSDVKDLVAAGNTVFFDGYTDKYGSELYAGDATQVITNKINKTNTETAKPKPATFSATVLQNPVHNNLNLSIKSEINQKLHIVVSNERGNVITQQNLSVNKGNTNINLSASTWHAGVYLIQLTGNNGDAVSLTALK